MTTQELILELFNGLKSALPDIPVFLDSDGKIVRNAVTPDKNLSLNPDCVEEALADVGKAVIVCARATTRTAVDASHPCTLRRISIPVEVRTRQLGDDDDGISVSVSEMLDQVEAAIGALETADITDWELGQSGEYENKAGWGYCVAEHLYQLK